MTPGKKSILVLSLVLLLCLPAITAAIPFSSTNFSRPPITAPSANGSRILPPSLNTSLRDFSHSPAIMNPTRPGPSFSSFYYDRWLKNIGRGLEMLADEPDACWIPIDDPIAVRRFVDGPGPGQYSGIFIDGYYCSTPWIPHIHLAVIGNP